VKAAFCIGSGKFEIRDVPAPQPRKGQALVRVKACGICGGDKRALAAESVPERISGHELSGVVEQVSSDGGFAVGDEVAVDPVCFCGECKYCRAGRTSLCQNRDGVIGYGAGGGFAEYVCVPVRSLCPKPSAIDFAEASMIEPLGVALRGAGQRDVTTFDCIVFGAGAIGAMLAQVLKLRGADRVYIVDIRESHLDAARQLGDFVTVNARDESPWDALEDADIRAAYDVVGKSSDVLDRAVSLLRPTGALIQIGAHTPGALRMDVLDKKNLTLIRSAGVDIGEIREAADLLGSGQVRVGPLITDRFPLERIEDAFAASLDGIKVVVEP